MMPAKDFANFILRHARNDTPGAFAARLARFGLIGLYSLPRLIATERLRGYPLKYKEARVNHYNMWLNPQDPGISTDLLLDGTREPCIFKVLSNNCGQITAKNKSLYIVPPGSNVIDIGANIGYYAIPEALLTGPNGHVYAVEPVPDNLTLLDMNIGLNDLKNVSMHRHAIGNNNGQQKLYISPLSNMNSFVKKPGFRSYDSTLEVPIYTLDKFCELNRVGPYDPTEKLLSLIRMDVEGYELEILQGGSITLAISSPRLLVEIHFDILGPDKTTLFINLLADHGYEVEAATFEPHMALYKAHRGRRLLHKLDEAIGAATGLHHELSLDDLLEKRFTSGQVEDLQVMFARTKTT